MWEAFKQNPLFSGIIGALITMILTKIYDTWRDSKKSKLERRLWIFRALAQDRFHGLSDNFVAAINLIPIEFNGKKEVEGAWDKLRDAHHNSGDEVIRKRTNELLIEIGKVLKFKNLNFTDSGYFPQHYVDNYQRVLLRDGLLIKLLQDGKITIVKEDFNNDQKINTNKFK